jgi:predicted adenylyl cyclase CyaB
LWRASEAKASGVVWDWLRYPVIPPMPANIEIKAILKDAARAEETAARLSGAPAKVIPQVDVFFRSETARLKLRIFGPDSGELIRYQRPDIAEARSSRYLIARTADPQALLEILSVTLGTAGTVRKSRRLFLIGQTRVHIDEVDGLGSFLELEVVLRPEQSEAEGRLIVKRLLTEFAINPDHLIAEAYVDLLRSKAGPP